MSSTDKAALLAQVRDIHEPIAPEPGWPWLLAAVAIGLGLLLVLWKNRPQKPESIASAQINAARTEAPAQALIRLARLLRSNVIETSAYDGQLQGDAWLAVLNARFNTTFFTEDNGRVFGEDLYKDNAAQINTEQLCDQLANLINNKPRSSI